jgi:prepilin-type N-terminal cleavage/methylation domain-containing protein
MKIDMLTGRFEHPHFFGRQLGFTLIEVVLVLVIVSVLTAAIVSRNSHSTERAKLHGEVALIKTQLRYAQARSLNANEVWGMKADGTSLWLFQNGDEDDKKSLPGESGEAVFYNDTDDRKKGLRVAPFLVSFDDRGQPCTDAAGIDLAETDTTVTVSSTSGGLPPVDINITPNTGFIQ